MHGSFSWLVSRPQPKVGLVVEGPLFLVGPQRSGTTALGIMLSRAISDIGGCFTVNGRLPYMLQRWWRDADLRAIHMRADEVVHGLRRMPVLGESGEQWQERACFSVIQRAQFALQNDTSMIEDIREICETAYGGKLWGDKYNEYLTELPALSAIFPDARWIYLYREPESVVASMLEWRKNKPWNPTSDCRAADKWAFWTNCWNDFRSEINPAMKVEILYDDLCAGRHQDLSDFINIDLGPYLVEFKEPAKKLKKRIRLTGEAVRARQRFFGLHSSAGL